MLNTKKADRFSQVTWRIWRPYSSFFIKFRPLARVEVSLYPRLAYWIFFLTSKAARNIVSNTGSADLDLRNALH